MPIPHNLCPVFPSIPSNDPFATKYKGKLIIIGAGVSGISAAISLQRMGFEDVTVLEASPDCVGGRLKSTSAFEGLGCSLDIGAEWIHSSYNNGANVLRTIAQFGDTDDDDEEDKHELPELIPYQPTWHLRNGESRLMRWLYQETKFKSTTWHEWFTVNLFEKVKDRVVMDSPVVKIDYHSDPTQSVGDGDEDEDAHGNVKLTLKDGSVLSADRVICTAPLAVLKDNIIDFSPPLPESMQASIKAIDMPPGFRILFQMKERFYNDLRYPGTMMDLLKDGDDLNTIYDPLLGKGIENIHVIAFVAIGPKNAGEMSQLSDEDLAKVALKKIDDMYDGKGSLNLIGAPVVQNWTAVDYIRGAYTFPCKKDLREKLRKPLNGKLFFAGEHTSLTHHSLVPGAACEGRRAALEVLSSLTGNLLSRKYHCLRRRSFNL